MEPITLSPGGHITREEGMCLLEAVAFLAGEEHSDHPTCVSSVLGPLGRSFNDTLFRDNLGALVPFAGRFIGTAGQPEVDQQAAYLLADWSVREVASVVLESSGLADQAAVLRALPSIVDNTSAADAAAHAAAAHAAAHAAAAADAASAVAAAATAASAVDAACGAAYAAAYSAAYATAYAASAADAASAAAYAAATAGSAADAVAAAATAASAASAADAVAAVQTSALQMLDRVLALYGH